MNIGLTGTRQGMTLPQKRVIKGLCEGLLALNIIPIARHGDAIGSDATYDAAIRYYFPNTTIHIHPPLNPKYRAFCDGPHTIIHPEKEFGVRDRDIVNAVNKMLATPRLMEEELRSGTWQTIRYTKKAQKQLLIIWPDGSLENCFEFNLKDDSPSLFVK